MVTQPGRHLTALHPPRLRRLTRAHHALTLRPELTRVAAQALLSLNVSLAQQLSTPCTIEARLLDAVASPDLAPCAVFFLLELSALGAAAVLELEPGVLLTAVECVAGATSRSAPVTRLTRLEDATLGYLALCGLAPFRSAEALERACSPRLVSLTMERSEALACLEVGQRYAAIELSLAIGAARGHGRLLLPAVALQAAAQRFPLERPRSLAPEVARAALEARCFLGRTRLSPEVFESLQPGDVVLFEGLGLQAGAPTGPGRLVTRGFTVLGQFQAEGFTPTRALPGAPLQEHSMTAPHHPELDGLPPLPVELEVELTRLSLTVAELATLHAGALLPLRINASEPVLLRVGTRAVARAELVDIDGEVGARVLELLP